MKTLTQEEFIEKAKEKHPQYDYSKALYINNKAKLIITCPIHGDFEIRPDCLLKGTGCPQCGGTHKMTNEEFIRKANIVHNNYFSYKKCNFNGVGNKVTVTCPVHGDFEVNANNHLNGCNCKKCQKEGITHKIDKLPQVNKSTHKKTTVEFINESKNKWGDRYTYENVVYVRSNEYVKVTCPIHGDFNVTPNHFLNGRGCPKCGKNYRWSTNEFIDRMKKINGDRYSYEKTVYKTVHTPVTITCPVHGDFVNQPSNLLKGQGCPCCQESILEKTISELLTSKNIKFEREKHFKWLGKQSLDFYLKKYSIGIECQGIQHFEEVPFFRNMTLNDRILLDEKKIKKCANNGINIIYYTDLKKYVDNIRIFDIQHINNLLDKILNEHD